MTEDIKWYGEVDMKKLGWKVGGLEGCQGREGWVGNTPISERKTACLKTYFSNSCTVSWTLDGWQTITVLEELASTSGVKYLRATLLTSSRVT